MRLGAHLPLADLGDGHPTAVDLVEYAGTARDLGFTTLAANDHLIWRRSWLDGPTTLASVSAAAAGMDLATTVALPVVRNPVVVAKMLTTLAALAHGSRVIGGLGPGSSPADYAAVGIPFGQRWARFDEALHVVRSLVRGEPAGPAVFYEVASGLEPLPDPPPEVWFGSWGSDVRLAAMAAVADGWFASAYNATPDQYREARSRLDDHLRAAGREPDAFPDALATMWLYVTESSQEAEEALTKVLAPALNRDPALLVDLPIGSSRHCSEVLARYAAAGAREVLVWPVRGGLRQLELCATAAAAM